MTVTVRHIKGTDYKGAAHICWIDRQRNEWHHGVYAPKEGEDFVYCVRDQMLSRVELSDFLGTAPNCCVHVVEYSDERSVNNILEFAHATLGIAVYDFLLFVVSLKTNESGDAAVTQIKECLSSMPPPIDTTNHVVKKIL